METEGEEMNSKAIKTKRIKSKTVTKDQFRDFEAYCIEIIDDMKHIHIDHYSWKNDGRYGDENLSYTVREYILCVIPLKDILKLSTDERREFLDDCEANVMKFEYDYTWADFKKEGYASPGNAKYLDPKDLTKDTPCGDYYCYI